MPQASVLDMSDEDTTKAMFIASIVLCSLPGSAAAQNAERGTWNLEVPEP